MIIFRAAGPGAGATMGPMSYWSLTPPLRPDEDQDMPDELKAAFRRWGRASAALRLYKRRGWNDSAVRFAFERERREVQRIIREMEHREMNPSLF